ncbi:MAG: ion transporter [Devosiaceae bacterium]|nr:ion transporter [Devosiaceae bacterium]
MNLKRIIENDDTRYGRHFDNAIQGLVIFSIVMFCLDTLPNLSEEVKYWFWIIEVVTIFIFTIEYILRIYVADNKLGYIFSFFGLVDLLAILPFYLATSIDLRSVRIFRLFRLFRVLKLLRFSAATERNSRALTIAKEELILFAIATGMMMFISAVGIYYFENEAQPETFASVFHAMWWSVTTLTTVGYGDMFPITLGGKIFSFLILMIGLGIVAVPAGLMASALSKARLEQDKANDQ